MHVLFMVMMIVLGFCLCTKQTLILKVNAYHLGDASMIANIVVLDKYGDTPLHSACYQGKIKVVECLLEFKAGTSIKSESSLLVYLTY